jgi:hypothetical protein
MQKRRIIHKNDPKWYAINRLLPAWKQYLWNNSALLNDYSCSEFLSMVDGVFGTKELLFPILIVGEKSPSSNSDNSWIVSSVNISIYHGNTTGGREIF